MPDLKRSKTLVPGKDCVRNPCGKGSCVPGNAGGTHGIRSDIWMYAVSDGEIALSLRVSSNLFPDSVPRTKHVEESRCSGDFLFVHTAFPTDKASLRRGDRGDECEYLDGGRCFGEDPRGCYAGEFFELHGAQAFEQPETFWAAFEAEWQRSAQEWREARVDDKFARCSHCDGTGVVVAKKSDPPGHRASGEEKRCVS